MVLLCPEGPPRTGIPGKARENPGERPKTAEIGAWDPPGKPPPAGVPIDSGGPDSAFEDCALGIRRLFRVLVRAWALRGSPQTCTLDDVYLGPRVVSRVLAGSQVPAQTPLVRVLW